MSLLQQLYRRGAVLYHHRPLVVDVLACGLLPGAVLGLHLAGLLLFLNAEVGYDLLPVASIYAAELGIVGLLLQLPWTLRRPHRARRMLPWGLTLALLTAALGHITHASHYAFYRPPGINSRLIKIGLVLAVTGLVAFYTALLHTLHRRRYGRRSRWGFALLILISTFSLAERLESYTPKDPRARSGGGGTERPRLHLYTVALEGATLDAILPLAEQGRTPFFATMLREGAAGRLESLTPNRRPALWTTLATGKHPYRHGILGDRVWPFPPLGPDARLRLLPAGILFSRWGLPGVVPQRVDRRDQKVLGLWQVLTRLGVPSATIGWPVTDPPPAELQFSLAETFFHHDSPPASALPAGVAERARLFEVTVDDLGPVLLSRFGADPPPPILGALAQDAWRQSLGLFLIEQYPQVGAHFIALPGLAVASEETFGGYAEVQFEGSGGAPERSAYEQLAAYYGQLDQFLAALWERVPQPALLAVVSPSGAAPRGWGQVLLGGSPLGGTLEGDADGVLLLLGPGVRSGARLTDARLEDVVPTLVYAFGFPIAKDLDGKVLTGAFEAERVQRQPLAFVPSYETLALPDGG